MEKEPSVAVIEVFAAIENVHPTNLTRKLYDYIDPEALGELVERSNGISVSFSVDQYQIQMDGDTVAVTC